MDPHSNPDDLPNIPIELQPTQIGAGSEKIKLAGAELSESEGDLGSQEEQAEPTLALSTIRTAPSAGSDNIPAEKSNPEYQPIARGNFSRNAARFSLAAPTFWLVISCLAARPIQEMTSDSPADPGWWLNAIVGTLTLTMIVGGFVLGIAAAISGRRSGNHEVYGMGLMGAIFNFGVLIFFAVAVSTVWSL